MLFSLCWFSRESITTAHFFLFMSPRGLEQKLGGILVQRAITDSASQQLLGFQHTRLLLTSTQLQLMRCKPHQPGLLRNVRHGT